MITTNTGAKKIEGTDNWREIFDAHNDSVNAHDKVSEGMTYVVNGNKSIENAAIPVGSLVRLANSTIVGRSDGIYTVKTAIPVDTVIDSSYFNESAPIAGGVANALNDNITPQSVTFTPKNCKVERAFIKKIGKLVIFTLEIVTTATTYVDSGTFSLSPSAETPIIAQVYGINANNQVPWGRVLTNGKLALFYSGGNDIPSGVRIMVQGSYTIA